jgi:hypothetical protein
MYQVGTNRVASPLFDVDSVRYACVIRGRCGIASGKSTTILFKLRTGRIFGSPGSKPYSVDIIGTL